MKPSERMRTSKRHLFESKSTSSIHLSSSLLNPSLYCCSALSTSSSSSRSECWMSHQVSNSISSPLSDSIVGFWVDFRLKRYMMVGCRVAEGGLHRWGKSLWEEVVVRVSQTYGGCWTRMPRPGSKHVTPGKPVDRLQLRTLQPDTLWHNEDNRCKWEPGKVISETERAHNNTNGNWTERTREQ